MTDRGFRNLIERQIQKAKSEGQLDRLEGEGKPLPDHPEEAMIDTATAAGHRIMAEAGALPEEIVLKRRVAAAREAVQAAGPENRKAAMSELAELEMKLAIAQEARRAFMKY